MRCREEEIRTRRGWIEVAASKLQVRRTCSRSVKALNPSNASEGDLRAVEDTIVNFTASLDGQNRVSLCERHCLERPDALGRLEDLIELHTFLLHRQY